MEKLKLTEILKMLKKEGIPITKRTFEYYQRLDLLPKPTLKRVGKKGRGVYGYYDPEVIHLVKRIFSLKNQGYTLTAILKWAEQNVLDRYKAVLKKWGFSGYTLPEMKGYPSLSPEKNYQLNELITRQTLKKMGRDNPKEEELKLLTEEFSPEREFEKKLLKQLHWWDPDNAIEYEALAYIEREAFDARSGLYIALNEMLQEFKSITGKKANDLSFKLTERVVARIRSLNVLQSKSCKRIAELINDEYKGRTKEGWEKIEKMWQTKSNGTDDIEDLMKI